MAITASQVKELRDKTGAGMLDCKKMLEQANGDMEKAISLLREKGLASAEKKAGRIAAEGVVSAYIHGGRIGVLVEVNCETDFVAKTEEFQSFVRDIAMQIAAMKPSVVRREELTEELLAQERETLRKQAENEGKPEKILDKVVSGRLEKRIAELCLLDQPFIKDGSKTVGELVKEQIAKIGENVDIRRFVRYELGEGIEKRQENFAEEVMSQVKG